MRCESKLAIAWLNARPCCWVATNNYGETWVKLDADDADDSSAAVDEAVQRFGGPSSKWDLLDDELTAI